MPVKLEHIGVFGLALAKKEGTQIPQDEVVTCSKVIWMERRVPENEEEAVGKLIYKYLKKKGYDMQEFG